MRKLLILLLLLITAQPVHAHGLNEEPLLVEEGGYTIKLLTEPKYPVQWKGTALVVAIEKDGLPAEGLRVAFTLHYPGHSGSVSIEAAPRGRGMYSAEHTFQERGEYEVHVGFGETQGAFVLKVDGLGVKGVLRGLVVLLILGVLIMKSIESCRGDENAED